MKLSSGIVLMILCFCVSCKSPRPEYQSAAPAAETAGQAVEPRINYSDPETWLIGDFSLSRLSRAPHSEWYISGKDGYYPNPEMIQSLRGISKENLSVRIVLGTWCPDSRREVPRFMKIMDMAGFPETGIRFTGVDNMKVSPVENYQELNIQRVPTFIFYKNNIEAGRIIEVPVTSLEQDMLNILQRNEKQ